MSLPASGYFTAPGRKNLEAKQAQDDMLDFLLDEVDGDADTLGGMPPDTAATANTIAQRDASGNLTAVLFNGTATSARYA